MSGPIPPGDAPPGWLCWGQDISHLGQNLQRSIRYYRQMWTATPKWANHKRIVALYTMAKRVGKTVDHIVPLNNPIVCGLHCEDNLQLLSGELNGAKGNIHWPDMPNEQLCLFPLEEQEQHSLL